MRQGHWLAVATAAFLSPAAAPAVAAELADAAMRGDIGTVDRLLEEGIEVTETQSDGTTALHWLAYAGDAARVQALIAAGADIGARTLVGVTPLALAAEGGHADVIESLLDAGADVDERSPSGVTALMMAARTGRLDALRVLLEHGADIDAKETLRGTTALMWAAAYANPGAARALLEHGADYAARSATTAPGRRPYLAPPARQRIADYYAGRGQAGTSVAVDLDGDDVADVGEPGREPPANATAAFDEAELVEFEQARERGETPDKEWGGLTALVFAAREGDIESARLLLDAGADVNQTTAYGWTALLTATQNRYYRLGKMLLERGADPNLQNAGGWSPLYIATDNRNIEGGDYPTRRPDMDHLEYIRLLLDYGADVNVRMNSSTETRTIFTHQWLFEDGATPFLRAAQSSDTELLALYLEHGADPSLTTYSGVTPLMVASGIGWVEGVTYEWSEEQNIETIELLLELGADVNARETVDGRTALMGAAHKGRNAVVRLLVDNGADLAARDIGSRDSIHALLGTTWQAIDYADGLVRVGVQSAIAHPETAALLRRLMREAGLEVPPEGRTLESICVVDICR